MSGDGPPLRIVAAESWDSEPPSLTNLPAADVEQALLAAIHAAGGPEMRLRPASATGAGEIALPSAPDLTPAWLELTASPPTTAARAVQTGVGAILAENRRLSTSVWELQARLAAEAPVIRRADEEERLAQRLAAQLRAAAELVGGVAAAVYLLDGATSSLSLRAQWNLPRDRWTREPRELAEAIADLEALAGHAVVLEDTRLLPHWRCPEDYPAAVCVPISTPSIPLGTLWVFAVEPRDFSAHETNLIEIVAGRIAADLEREQLLAAVEPTPRGVSDLSHIWQRDGWTISRAVDCDAFFWARSQAADQASFAAASLPARGAAGLEELFRGSVAAHAAHPHDAAELLARWSDTLAACERLPEHLLCGRVEFGSGVIDLAATSPLRLRGGVNQLGRVADWRHGSRGQAVLEGPGRLACRLKTSDRHEAPRIWIERDA